MRSMYQYHCLNPISQIGLDKFTENYQKTEAAEAADAILVRSASMHEMELPENLKVVARAGAGVNRKPDRIFCRQDFFLYSGLFGSSGFRRCRLCIHL